MRRTTAPLSAALAGVLAGRASTGSAPSSADVELAAGGPPHFVNGMWAEVEVVE